MIDPELIPSLRRRAAAFAVDLGLVTVLTGLVGRSRFQKFELERTPGTDELIPTAEQFEAITKLAAGFHRRIERGDARFIIDGMGVLLTLLVGIVLSVILFVVVPANTGWSLGKRLFGLRVIDTDGGTPTLLSFIARSVVGLIDILPFVVPGLLGFVLASRDPDRHRLGDRVAGTTVVDARRPLRSVDPAVMERRAALRNEDQDVTVDESMVDLGDRLGSATPPAPITPDGAVAALPRARPEPHPRQSEPQPDVQVQAQGPPTSTAPERASGTHLPPTHRTPQDHPRRPISESEARTWEPPVAEPAPVWIVGESLSQEAGAAQPHIEPASIAAAAVTAPVWNEQWHAWLFWDPDGQRWLRHDETSGVWEPIS
ncbi:MAG: RDD family protein [Actinomycetota bacterium]|nr:RDD family protein [Actinomycetota bacterium]